MKIGIISDSHDRIEAVEKVIGIFEKQNVETIIHCGDMCAPFMIDELAKFKGEVYCIAGNICDKGMTCEKAIKEGVNFDMFG